MIKMMAAICRKPGMTHAEYVAYVQHEHGAISNENPVTLRRYVQNHVFDAAFGSGAEAVHVQTVARDSVTELFWDSPQDMAATFGHEHVRTVAAAAVRPCVHNRQLAEFNPMLAYFGARDVPIYEGVASLWFDDTASVGAFRACERALLAVNAEPDAAFYQPAQSFFVYATEVPIYERPAP
jgi:hypothetical protein